ncbi:MAG: TonB-dependent siderophore receptor [Cyanobacteria bacterium J06621_8]
MKLLSLLLSAAGVSALVWVSPVVAETDLARVSKSASDLLAQGETRVTGVEVVPTESGLELILKTAAGSERLVPLIVPEENDLVIDILNATLAFSIRNGVTELDPAPGIELITVTQVDPNSIQVRITGTDQTPSAEILGGSDDLVLSITPETATADEEDQIDIIATGQVEEDSYKVDQSNITATRTETPLRDIPQSIQVIPRKVIEDQNVIRIGDALRNVSGVLPQRDFGGSNFRFSTRGFEDTRLLRNGIRTGRRPFSLATSPNTIERIEVLKGPSSVVFGPSEPGGLINLITKQPEKEASYDFEFRTGSFDFFEPSIDFTGPLTGDEKLTYRLNISYQSDGLFRNFVESELFSIAPVLRYEFSDKTDLTLEYEYLVDDRTFDSGIPADPFAFEAPEGLFLEEPGSNTNTTANRFFVTLNHSFNDDVRLRSVFGGEIGDEDLIVIRPFFGFDPETGIVERLFQDSEAGAENFSWQTDLITEFKTGPVEHQLLAGFDLTFTEDLFSTSNVSSFRFPINAFNPVYDDEIPPNLTPDIIGSFDFSSNTVGFYLQDLVTLLPNLKLLVGGRFDFADEENEFNISFPNPSITEGGFEDEAFSPRVGIVYQPIEPISLFANFTRSFIPNSASTVDGTLIEPERGRQFEVGVKAEFGDIAVSLAAYDIVKSNLAIADPFNPGFSAALGEVNSQGIELDVAGEILDGWNIIVSGFINDAVVTEGDDSIFLGDGDQLTGAPENGASLWTTYEIQKGSLKGFGFGAGFFFVGDTRESEFSDFVIPSYVRADASLFYKQEIWEAQLNFQNIFDEDYLESSNNTGLLYDGAPFSVIGSLSLKL